MRVSWLLYEIYTVRTVCTLGTLQCLLLNRSQGTYLLTLQLRDESTLFTNYKRFYLIKTN